MHLPHEGRLKWMKYHLNFELDEIERKLFYELYEIRNGIVHGNSQNYRDQIKTLFKTVRQHPEFSRYNKPDHYNSAFLEGKDDSQFISRQNEITLTLFIICFTFLCFVGFKMILAFWTKINEKYESDHVYIFNTHIYSLFNTN